jgi:hypothetical protein
MSTGDQQANGREKQPCSQRASNLCRDVLRHGLAVLQAGPEREVLGVQRVDAEGGVGVGIPPGAVDAGVVDGQDLGGARVCVCVC